MSTFNATIMSPTNISMPATTAASTDDSTFLTFLLAFSWGVCTVLNMFIFDGALIFGACVRFFSDKHLARPLTATAQNIKPAAFHAGNYLMAIGASMVPWGALQYFTQLHPVFGTIWGFALFIHCEKMKTRLEKEWFDLVQCRGCSKVGWDRAPFCKECGIKGPFVEAIEMEGRCAGCGTLGEIKSRYCPNCGELVNEGEINIDEITKEGRLEEGQGEALMTGQ